MKRYPVAIIIPTKDNLDLLFTCLHSLKAHCKYPTYKLYIVDTGSAEENIKTEADYLEREFPEQHKLILLDYYHFAKVNNLAVTKTTEPVLLFMNNDVFLMNDCVTLAADVLARTDNVGTVGIKMLLANGRLQHAGQEIVLNEDGSVGIGHRDFGSGEGFRYMHEESVLGNTGAFMMIKRHAFSVVGGFPETYSYCFEDLELNLNLLLKGYKNIFLGYAAARHLDGRTRCSCETDEEVFVKDRQRIEAVFRQAYPKLPAGIVRTVNRTLHKVEWSLFNSDKIESEFPCDKKQCVYMDPNIPENFIKQKKFEERYDLNSSDGKLHVLMLGHQTGCGFVRIDLPAKYLNRFPDIAAFPCCYLTPELINWAHLIVWEAGITDQYAEVRKLLSDNNVPQVFEIDDNYSHINKYNLASCVFDKGYVEGWLKGCNVTTVTRPALGEYYKGMVPELKYEVLPNCIDFERMPVKQAYQSKKDIVRIGWYGGRSHYEDLLLITPALCQIQKEYGDKVEFVIFGWDGQLESEYKKDSVFTGLKFRHVPWVHMTQFYTALASLDLDIMLIPLEDNAFNQTGKSPLKFLESSACRYPCIISKSSVFEEIRIRDREHAVVVQDPGGWYPAVRELVEKPELRKYISDSAYSFVRETYDIERWAHKWASVYRTLASARYTRLNS